MIIENGRSRVYLGVHWVFAFAIKDDNQIDLSRVHLSHNSGRYFQQRTEEVNGRVQEHKSAIVKQQLVERWRSTGYHMVTNEPCY